MKIIAMRHGVSEGNKKRIIQGQLDSYALSEMGRTGIQKIALDNKEILSDVYHIWSSDSLRANETANEVISHLGLDMKVHTNELLREMDPGILSGLTHEEADNLFPHYYDIWSSRGDLDGIPGAESGKQLQARAIAFLQFILDQEKPDSKVLLVTHAGFLRCFCNTCRGKERTTPIDVSNGCIHVVDEKVFLENRILVRQGEDKKVYKVNTCNGSYIVKVYYQPKNQLKGLYDRQFADCGAVLCQYCSGDYMVVVMNYYKGEHYHGQLNDELLKKAWQHIYTVQENLIDRKCFDCISLEDKLDHCVTMIDNPVVKRIGKQCIEYCRSISSKNRKNVLYDLHRDNFVLSEGNWEAVDFDGILEAPSEYLLACFIAAFILIEQKNVNIDWVKEICLREEYKFEIVRRLVSVRLYMGMCYFERKFDKKSRELEQKYVEAFFDWISYSRKYLDCQEQRIS